MVGATSSEGFLVYSYHLHISDHHSRSPILPSVILTLGHKPLALSPTNAFHYGDARFPTTLFTDKEYCFNRLYLLMVALWNRETIYIFMLWFVLLSFFYGRPM